MGALSLHLALITLLPDPRPPPRSPPPPGEGGALTLPEPESVPAGQTLDPLTEYKHLDAAASDVGRSGSSASDTSEPAGIFACTR